ncbi:NAD(P)-binding protein [Prochlorococcus sp. AH-716-D13]|nr:NAD(P)-binding protein [Prochlorococcus sp. AH-716-D13]
MNLNSAIEKQNIVVLGGGIPGIFSALYLSEIFKNHQIHLIEANSTIGGLYNSINDPIAGTFDKGMHIIYETCDEEIDSIIRSSLDEKDWIFLEGNHKDIAGVYFKGELNKNSPYLSLSQVDKENYSNCIRDLFEALQSMPPNLRECKTADEFFIKRFGNSLYKELFKSALEKLWRINPDKLHPAITRIILMDRLIIFDEECVKDLMNAQRLRSRIAFPNQMNLDLSFRSKQRGLYPKSFGMTNVIKGLEKKLIEADIKIHKNTKLHEIQFSNNEINSLSIESNNNLENIGSVKLLHSTVSPLQLLKFFNKEINFTNYDKPLTQRYVYLLLKNRPNMRDLYYYYSFEKGMKTYRVTNYGSYCPDALRDLSSKYSNSWPICIELHYAESELDHNNVLNDAIKELLITGVISDKNEIIFSKVHSAGGVPLLTIKNCKIASDAYDYINNLKIKNLLFGCQLPEKGIFFLHDVLLHTKEMINKFKKLYPH